MKLHVVSFHEYTLYSARFRLYQWLLSPPSGAAVRNFSSNNQRLLQRTVADVGRTEIKISHKHSMETQAWVNYGRRARSSTAVTTALSKARPRVIYTIYRAHRGS